MAILSIDGFESGVFLATAPRDKQYETVGGSPSSSTTVRAGTGSRSVSGGTNLSLERAIAQSSGSMSFAFYVSTTPSAAGSLAEFVMSRTNCYFRLRCNTSRQLYVDIMDNGIVQSTSSTSSALTASTWYWIDVKYNVSSASWTFEFKIDGGTAISTSTSISSTTSTIWKLNNNSTGGVWLFDDWICADESNYPLGQHKVLAFNPDADGTHSNAGNFRNEGSTAISGANPAHDEVSTIPFQTTNFVEQSTTSGTSYLELTYPNTTETADAIGVRFSVGYFSSATQANSGLTKFSSNSFTNVSEPGVVTANTAWDMSESSLRVVSKFHASPVEGGSWTPTKVDGLTARIGYSGDASPFPRWTGLLAEVAYAIASGTTFNQAVSATSSATASFVKQAGKSVSASATSVASFLKRAAKSLSVTSSSLAFLSKSLPRTLVASSTATASLLAGLLFNKILSANAGGYIPGGNSALIDDFNRANENPLSGYSDAWWTASGDWKLLDNKITPVDNSGSNIARRTTGFAAGDCVIFAQIWGVNAETSFFNMALRRVDTNTAGYGLDVHQDYVRLDKFGPSSGVLAGPTAHTFVDGDWFALALEGDDVVLYHSPNGKSWTQKLRATDTDSAIRGFTLYPGVFNSAPSETLLVDNLSGGEFTLASLSGNIVKRVGKFTTASSTGSASFVKVASKTVVTSTVGTASVVKGVGKALVASATGTASMVASRLYLRTLDAFSTATGAFLKHVGKPLATSSTGTAAITRISSFLRTLTAASSGTSTLLKQATKSLAASSVGTAALTSVAAIVRTLSASSTATASFVRNVGKALTASATHAASLVAQTVYNLSLSAVSSGTAAMTRLMGKILSTSSIGSAVLTTVIERLGQVIAWLRLTDASSNTLVMNDQLNDSEANVDVENTVTLSDVHHASVVMSDGYAGGN